MSSIIINHYKEGKMPKNKIRVTPTVGSVFQKKFNGKIYLLTVIKSSNGVAYNIGNLIFATPTAAAKSIQKTEVNGWKFWKMDK
jgi:hypothetical protein